MALHGNSSPSTSTMPQGYVHLNVGGTCYTTSLSTLTRYKDSMLYNMFTQENIPLAKDNMGRYIIDRDGVVFRYILNFLRGANLNLPPRFGDYEQLKEEVDFYQLDDMKELLELWRIMNWKDNTFVRRAERTYYHKVGDQHFHISRDHPFSYSNTIRNLAQGKHGDCDPVVFKYIANFLSKRASFMPKSQEELKKLKATIQAYQIPEMMKYLDQNFHQIPTF
ncbi:BTB/POZ domain-containing protein KCTD6 [Holothuria leucospilota]|uniref:BTB/POZ domain-containing protein KCTD6 n=1 Tax=Holothuria leucospilota TaxID=206669 RepID=A0A9Q0YTV6_HOLLE|nr:BTB/POZ domain-containing protein KCTD6 [Holothuria leucospilota]